MNAPGMHGWMHRPKELGGTDPIGLVTGAHYEIVVVEADEALTAGDGLFYWPVPDDLNGYHLVKANAGVQTTSSSGDVQVMIRNAGVDKTGTVDMLTDPITIQAGDLSSYETGGAAGVVDTGNDVVATGEWLAVDCDADGTGTEGLIVILVFDSIPGGVGAIGPTGAQGPQGDPGADGADGADGSDGASNAVDVAVADAGNYFTGTDAEAVLQEIGASLGGSGGGLFDAYAHIVDQKSAGTAGGTISTGSFGTRDLNTELSDVDGIVSISSNQFTLQAGRYYIEAEAPAFYCNEHKIILRNVTDSTNDIIGANNYAATGTGSLAVLRGEITIAGAKAFAIQHRGGNAAGGANTLGYGPSWGVVEIYTQVRIWRFA